MSAICLSYFIILVFFNDHCFKKQKKRFECCVGGGSEYEVGVFNVCEGDPPTLRPAGFSRAEKLSNGPVIAS